MTGTDLFPIKQDQYSGRLGMIGFAKELPDPLAGTRSEGKIVTADGRIHFIVGGCGGTQYGCKDGRSRTKEEFEADRKLATLPIEVPEIIKPLIEKDETFEEILEAESGGIEIGKAAMLKTIITGVIVGIILMKVIK